MECISYCHDLLALLQKIIIFAHILYPVLYSANSNTTIQCLHSKNWLYPVTYYRIMTCMCTPVECYTASSNSRECRRVWGMSMFTLYLCVLYLQYVRYPGCCCSRKHCMSAQLKNFLHFFGGGTEITEHWMHFFVRKR